MGQPYQPVNMAYNSGSRAGQESAQEEIAALKQQLHQAKTKTDEQASALRKANDKVDVFFYNLFLYAEDDPDVNEMTGGVPLLGWLEDRQEKAARRENAETTRKF